MVKRSISMALGSLWVPTYRGAWLFCGYVVVPPLLQLRISCALRCWASNLDAWLYHSAIVSGSLLSENIFWSNTLFSASMKYSIWAHSSLIPDRLIRILKLEMYLSAVSFPCRSWRILALASPLMSSVSNAFLIVSKKSPDVPKSNPPAALVLASKKDSFQVFAIPSFMKDMTKATLLLSVS